MMRQESRPLQLFYSTRELRQLFRNAAQHPDDLRLKIRTRSTDVLGGIR